MRDQNVLNNLQESLFRVYFSPKLQNLIAERVQFAFGLVCRNYHRGIKR